jgi:hypothetical protein
MQLVKQMEIIPFKCHICGSDYEKMNGAFCARCKKETCERHLKLVNFSKRDKLATPEMIVCEECLKENEKFIKFSMKYFSEKDAVRIFWTK